MTPREGRILIADDDPEDLEMIEAALLGVESRNTIHSAFNGKEAVEYLNNLMDEQLPNLIILDYNMPELTGSQVLSLICSQPRYKHIPKVMLSTSNAPLHMHECLANGAMEYFVKPNTMQELDVIAKKMLTLLHFAT